MKLTLTNFALMCLNRTVTKQKKNGLKGETMILHCAAKDCHHLSFVIVFHTPGSGHNTCMYVKALK